MNNANVSIRCLRLGVCVPAPVTRFPGAAPGTCFAGAHSPWPPPFAPPAPQPVARLCSSASQLLWRSLTSQLRSSLATAPRLPNADQMAQGHWPDLGPPGSRARSFDTCQVLRPRRVDQALAIARLAVLPSAFETESAPGISDFVARWLACALPYRRFAAVLTNGNARLGADVGRYSFIVSDFHRLLLAGLPAHFESDMPSHAVRSLVSTSWPSTSSEQ